MHVINTNILSLNAQRNVSANNGALATAVQRLSSGLRVNSAKDDAAGLAIASRMSAQVRGMNVAIRNANDGISLAQTAEGALGKITDMLQRMRELAVQASNGTNSSTDITSLGEEYTQLKDEISRVVDSTKFNGNELFTATATDKVIQVGADNVASNDRITITAQDLSGVDTAIGTAFTTAAEAQTAIDTIDDQLDAVNTARAEFGAVQNRFESVISNLQVSVENTAAARSRIMDADFASETAALTRAQILQQAGTAMLAQANAAPQSVLSLLRG